MTCHPPTSMKCAAPQRGLASACCIWMPRLHMAHTGRLCISTNLWYGQQRCKPVAAMLLRMGMLQRMSINQTPQPGTNTTDVARPLSVSYSCLRFRICCPWQPAVVASRHLAGAGTTFPSTGTGQRQAPAASTRTSGSGRTAARIRVRRGTTTSTSLQRYSAGQQVSAVWLDCISGCWLVAHRYVMT